MNCRIKFHNRLPVTSMGGVSVGSVSVGSVSVGSRELGADGTTYRISRVRALGIGSVYPFTGHSVFRSYNYRGVDDFSFHSPRR